ncbi:MAG: NIPSNAP family protein [Pseudomonadota bacterium]
MSHPPPSVIELRQYTLHPGQREVLIELFEREFIEPQEALGLQVIGQFRDLDRRDRFVWLRGFADMAARARGLAAFYGGPVWQRHRDAANATMIDSDNVLLLKPAWAGSGFQPNARPAAPADASGLLHATVCPLPACAGDNGLRGCFEREVLPALRAAGAAVHAVLVTDPRPNNFERLPVREDESVLAWLASGPPVPLPEGFARRLGAAPEVLRLGPTARSALRA